MLYENEKGEYVIVSAGRDEDGEYKEYKTYQKNGWIRINRYYKNCSTETYEKE